MTPTACPRCVAEQRARQLRVAAIVAMTLAIVVVCGTCCWAVPLMVDPFAGESGRLPSQWETVPDTILTVLVSAGMGLGACSALLSLRARWALRPPPTDPLATYRDGGPLECPRHPFAR